MLSTLSLIVEGVINIYWGGGGLEFGEKTYFVGGQVLPYSCTSRKLFLVVHPQIKRIKAFFYLENCWVVSFDIRFKWWIRKNVNK